MTYNSAKQIWLNSFEPGEVVTLGEEQLFALEYIARLLDARLTPAPVADDTPTTASLQQRAEFNREHAATLFSDKLVYHISSGRWITIEDHKPVLFTPYGWIRETDINPTNNPDAVVSW